MRRAVKCLAILIGMLALASCGDGPATIHGVGPGMNAVQSDALLQAHFGPQHPMTRQSVTGGFVYVNAEWRGTPVGVIVPEISLDPQGPFMRVLNPCFVSFKAAGQMPNGAECLSVGMSGDRKVTQLIRLVVVNGKLELYVID